MHADIAQILQFTVISWGERPSLRFPYCLDPSAILALLLGAHRGDRTGRSHPERVSAARGPVIVADLVGSVACVAPPRYPSAVAIKVRTAAVGIASVASRGGRVRDDGDHEDGRAVRRRGRDVEHRSTCAARARSSAALPGESRSNPLLLGHSSVATTERYLGTARTSRTRRDHLGTILQHSRVAGLRTFGNSSNAQDDEVTSPLDLHRDTGSPSPRALE
jgi:hypothetical protein